MVPCADSETRTYCPHFRSPESSKNMQEFCGEWRNEPGVVTNTIPIVCSPSRGCRCD